MIIRINAFGMENSLRTKKDGNSYFGYLEDTNYDKNVYNLYNRLRAIWITLSALKIMITTKDILEDIL